MLVVEIAGGIVLGLWCWGALRRWASQPTEEERAEALRRYARSLDGNDRDDRRR